MQRHFFFACVLAAGIVPALAADDWVGQKAMVIEWYPKMVDNGKESTSRLGLGAVVTVSKKNGDLLWVGRGWIDKSDVLPVDKAIDYFTTQVEQNLDSVSYHNRASA